MAGGIVSDILGTVGIYAWKILCAISIVSVSGSVSKFALHYYYAAKKRGTHGKMDSWMLGIQLSIVSAVLFTVTTIGALAIVLQKSWVEQITSAFVIGQGFALRGLVECLLWGYVIRYNLDEQKVRDKQITVLWGAEKVTGSVHRIDLMHAYITNDDGVHAVPWTIMQQYTIK